MRFMDDIQNAKLKKTTMTSREYYLLDTFEIFNIGGILKIIVKSDSGNPDIRYLVPYDEIYDSIAMCHKSVGHKGFY